MTDAIQQELQDVDALLESAQTLVRQAERRLENLLLIRREEPLPTHRVRWALPSITNQIRFQRDYLFEHDYSREARLA